MADVEGQIVLGLDISKTTNQINADLNRVLAGISKKEITLSAKIENINFGNAAAQIRNTTNQINQEFNSTLNVIDLVNGGISNLSRMLQGAGFSKGSISTVTQDLQRMSLQINKITTTMAQNGDIRLKISGTDELQRAVTIVRQYDNETGKVVNSSKTFTQSFKDSGAAVDELQKKLAKVQSEISNNKIEASISKVTNEFKKLGETGHERLTDIKNDLETLKNLQETMAKTQDASVLVSSYQQYEEVLARVKNNLSIVANETKEFTNATKENTAALTRIKSATLSNQIQTWMNQNAKASQVFGNELRELQERLANCSNGADLSKIRAEFAQIKSEAQAAGLTTNQFAQSLKNEALQVVGLTSVIDVIQKVISYAKEGINTIVELDTALVDLKKTTTMSDSNLASFYYDANDAAKELGVTTKDIIQSAADWSRLGYSDKKSSQTMAKLAAQFAAISPGVDINAATTGLVSIMKAYGIEADNVLDGIMSKINIIGNTAATSNKEIITGLNNSASAMAAMGATLEQNIALFTAAQEIIQDDSQVGNALRSISMRVRGYSEDTGELSDELANISGEVYDLTKATEDAQGVSLFTDETQEHYKDTYTYLHDISKIYNDLSETNQQALMEKLFGKNRANVGQAIIQNFEAAEKAMTNMANSVGNANAEMEVITESLEYKLNALKETGTGIFQNLFPQDVIGGSVDALTSVLGLIDRLTESFGLLGTAVAGGGIALLVKNLG